MSDTEVAPDCDVTKESPRGSVCESMNSDQVQEILEKLSISEIDTADSFNVSNNSEVPEDGRSPGKDDNSTKEDGKEDGDDGNDDKKDIDNNIVNNNDNGDKKGSKSSNKAQRRKSKSEESPKNGTEKKKKRPFSFLRRSFSKESNKEPEPAPSPYSGILKIRVESLPQVFITKYLGCKPCTGIWGAEHTVKPVQAMIEDAKKLGEGKDLSLVKVKVTNKGLEVSPHKENKGPEIESGLIPVEYISYGVQDFTYTRVFCFIMVCEMSYKAKKMECHAYVCPSTLNARKLSLSVALSFKEYAKSLEGKQFRFQVELGQKPVIDDRLPNMGAQTEEPEEEEC